MEGLQSPTNPLAISEEDGSPIVYPWKIKVPNDALVDNGDGTVSISLSTILAAYLKLDQTTPQTVVGGIPVSVQAVAPATPTEGLFYVNSNTNTVYIYYGGTWQALHNLTPAALSFLLLETGDTLLKEDGDKLALEA